MRIVNIIVIIILSSIVFIPTSSGQDSRKPADELPEIKELPNPFLFNDGSPVCNHEDWARRREELKELFQGYIYGYLPPEPQKMTFKQAEPVKEGKNEVMVRDLELRLEHNTNTLSFNVRITLPMNAKGKVPVIIHYSSGSIVGKKRTGLSGKHLTMFTGRGYAIAEFSSQQIVLDDKNHARASGIYRLFGDTISCGALMAWAWGVQRVIDAIENIPELDATKVIVTGHSRCGKAALIAGAFDERIALTVPSHSGCAGVAPYRFIYGKSEQLQNIVGFAPHWFRPNFNQFTGNENQLPVDQHLLIALVAPRAILSIEGTQDPWTNPEGAQLTHLAARKVYDFLNASDKISIIYHPVEHVTSYEDLLEYADHLFFDRALSEDFGKLPYKEETRGYQWNIPK
jgi:endo-1,4-beta-xylanase